MAEDIAPELLKKIQEEFHKNCSSNKELQEISKKVADGTANCEDLENYAIAAGEMLAKAMHDNVSGVILPDGKMYYNIASRIMPPNLEECYAMVADIAEGIYGILNEKAGIHIKALRPDLNKDRIDGLVNYVSNADQYEDVRKSTEQSMVTFSQSVATDAVHKNADFQYKAGLTPKIRRRAEGNCCKWCQSLEGTYDYADVRNTGNDVWRRHRDCRCEVTYDPGTGKVQNAHSKKWDWKEENKEKVEERKKWIKQQQDYKKARAEIAKWFGVQEKNVESIGQDDTIRPKRDQIDTGYEGKIPDDKLEEYNRKAVKQIMADTGYSEAEARKAQEAFTQYFGGDYETIETSPDSDVTKTIIDTLLKMPTYNGSISRGMCFQNGEGEVFTNLKPGDTLPIKGVIESWSSNSRVADSYGSVIYPGTSIILECDNNISGVGVQHLSKFGTAEAEVMVANPNYEVVEITSENKYEYIKNHKELWLYDDYPEDCTEEKGQYIWRIKVREKMVTTG